MNSRIGLWIVLTAICLSAAGCGKSESQSDRRAQLVGHENIQLKKQIQEKDKEIERLKDEIANLKQQAENEAIKQSKTYTKMLEIVADLTQQLEACKAGQAAVPSGDS